MSLEAALRRPKNFFMLTPREQWDIDKRLGILDWEGPESHEEAKLISDHHDLNLAPSDSEPE